MQRPLDASLLAEMQSGVPTPVQHNPAMAAFTNANVDHIFGPDSGKNDSMECRQLNQKIMMYELR